MREHRVAWWAGVSSFFGSLLAIGVIDVINPDTLIRFASCLGVAAITGGSVYSKERLDDAKRERERAEQEAHTGGSP